MKNFVIVMVTPICILLTIVFELIHKLTPGWNAMCGTDAKYYAWIRSGCCLLARLESMVFDTAIKILAWVLDEPEENLLSDLIQ